MADTFPLQTLLDLSNMRLDEAAKRLGQLLATETAAAEKVQILVTYRQEYQNRFVTAAQSGLRPDEWDNYRRFIARLDQAIQEAERQHQQTRNNVDSGRQAWLAQRNKVNAFDTLSARHEAKLVIKENRADQKRADEFAARGHERKQSEGD